MTTSRTDEHFLTPWCNEHFRKNPKKCFGQIPRASIKFAGRALSASTPWCGFWWGSVSTSVLNSIWLVSSRKKVSLTDILVQKRKPAPSAKVGTNSCQPTSSDTCSSRGLQRADRREDKICAQKGLCVTHVEWVLSGPATGTPDGWVRWVRHVKVGCVLQKNKQINKPFSIPATQMQSKKCTLLT